MTLAIALLAALLSACSHPVDVSTLAGKYTMNGGEGLETLELKPDGTYVHGYIDYSNAESGRSGSWELGDVDGAKTVTLHDYVAIRGEPTNGPDIYLLKVEHSLTGNLRLVTVGTPDRYYAK